jgi:hypothetical protein
MVGVITLSPSRRGAYEPASCLCGWVSGTPQREETSPFMTRRMSSDDDVVRSHLLARR